MKTRLALAFFVVAAALFVCSAKMYKIIRDNGDSYSVKVLNQQNYSSTVIPFRRGTIMDRNQTVLAASEQVFNLILDPRVLYGEEELSSGTVDTTVKALVACFGVDRDDVMLTLAEKKDTAYVRYKRQITKEEREKYEEYRTTFNKNKANKIKISKSGIWFETEYRRIYPNETLACTVLGFSGSDSNKGNWGIEQYYNDYLTGVNGREYGILNASGTVDRNIKAAQDGNTVITTIDYTIQKKTEELLYQFNLSVEADNTGVIVMNPQNGEILAMASSNIYNPNDPSDMSIRYTDSQWSDLNSQEQAEARNKIWGNFMVSETYEPGSTAKLITAAAALEEGMAAESTQFSCDGGEQLAKDTYVRCAHNHGVVNFREALAYSCNDAMMQLGSTIGKKTFCAYQDLFGLGKPTGIDLPGEAPGLLWTEDRMSGVDLGTNSFGQNYTVNMVQMAAAYASLINGGIYYQPHIVKEILSPNGEVIKNMGPSVVRETVSENTSVILRDALELCVNGESTFCTGTMAKLGGYSVGGKTGTAEKYPRGGGEYVVSFIGFTTVENPQVLVYVIVDNPHEEDDQTAKVAVRLEQKIMASIVEYLGITPGDRDQWEAAKQKAAEEAQKVDENGNPVETTKKDPSDVLEGLQEEAFSKELRPGAILTGDDGPPGASQYHNVHAGEGSDAIDAPDDPTVEETKAEEKVDLKKKYAKETEAAEASGKSSKKKKKKK